MQSLTSLHTFGLPASCSSIQTFEDVDSLVFVLKELFQASMDKNFLILGEGSNTIFVEDYPYPVLLNKIKGLSINDTKDAYHLKVGAGENWHELVEYCVEHGIGGFENLALIPGTVGAAPIQNIGAYGVEVERFIEKVEFYDLQKQQLSSFNHHQCEFAYRDSIFKRQDTNHRIITYVHFRLPKHYAPEISYGPLTSLSETSPQSIYQRVIEIRQSKLPDPKLVGNAGSFFKNPVVSQTHFLKLQKDYPNIPSYQVDSESVKIPAAWLIDTLGFKGKQVGNIACHKKQALVLVNQGNGKGHDLLTLARQILKDVFDQFEIRLENEVRLIGAKGIINLNA